MNPRYGYGYVRVSTDKQDELSPDSQEKLLREYAQKNNVILVNIFHEIGISGRTADKRPAFQEMISSAKCKEHPIDVILVWKYSRFARNQEESIVYKSLLKKQHNVDVVSVSEPLIDGPFGSLIERIIEWMDEYYSIRLSGEVFRGMKENALRGAYQARPPLGYQVIESGKPPVIVPEEAIIIKMIFSLYVDERKSFFEIARYLNLYGHKTSRNKNFETRSVEYIIQNPTYCGMIRWNRTENASTRIKDKNEWIVADGEHEGIISKELYQQAQHIYKSTYSPTGTRPASTYKHWLSGLLKCPTCGRSLTASTLKRSNGESYSYFTCYGYTKGKCTTCGGVSSLKLEKEIIHLIHCLFEYKEIVFEYLELPDSEQATRKELLITQLKGIAEKENRIKESYINGIDTIEEYKENKKMLQNTSSTLKDELNMLNNNSPNKKNDEAILRKKIHNVYEILQSPHYATAEKSDALRQITTRIIYDREHDTLKMHLYMLR